MRRYFKLNRKRPINIKKDAVQLYRRQGPRWIPSAVLALLFTVACYGCFQILSADAELLGPLETHQIQQTALGQPS